MHPHMKVIVSPHRQRTQHGGQGGNVHWTVDGIGARVCTAQIVQVAVPGCPSAARCSAPGPATLSPPILTRWYSISSFCQDGCSPMERSMANSACPSKIYPAGATHSCLPLMPGMYRDVQQSAQPRSPAPAPHPLRLAFAEPASAPPLLHQFVSSASPHRPPLFQRPELTDTQRSIIEPRGHLPRPQNAAPTGCW